MDNVRPRGRPSIHKKALFNELRHNIKHTDNTDDCDLDDQSDTSNDYEEESSMKKSKKKRAPITECSKKNSTLNYKFLICLIFLVVCCILLYIVNTNDNQKKTKNEHIESVLERVKRNLKNINSKYKNQERNLWANVYNGISNIIKNPKKPCILLLLGNKEDPLDCLAVLLGNVSSDALNSGTLSLTPEQFQLDVGSVIEKMRLTVPNNKAVIIWDLLNINVEALKAFHNLCDRINPLVEEVIYIITIIADGFDKESNALAFVEKQLFKKLLGKMKEDAIQPLITRITDGPIFIVQPEPTVTDCPLPSLKKKLKLNT